MLDEGRIADHPDPSLRNLASALFRLEFSFAPETFRAVWLRLFEWIDHPNQESLRRAFIAWANRLGLRRHLPGANLGELHDAQEIANSLPPMPPPIGPSYGSTRERAGCYADCYNVALAQICRSGWMSDWSVPIPGYSTPTS